MTVVGIDLGGSKVAGVLVDVAGRIGAEVWREHSVSDAASAVRLIDEVVTELAGPRGGVAMVGVAVAGWLDAERQGVLIAANLGMEKVALRDELAGRLGCPVLLANDGDAAAYAEYQYCAADITTAAPRSLLLFTLGTGVGGGIVVDGALLRGSHGQAGELGHLPIDLDGPPCCCGGRGCLELYASGPGIARAGGARDAVTARPVIDAARAGDAQAAGVLAGAGRALARAVALLVPVIDPDLVVVAGGVALAAGDLLLQPARDELAARHPLAAVLDPPPVILGRAGPNASALGAAALGAAALGGAAIGTAALDRLAFELPRPFQPALPSSPTEQD